MYSNYKRLYINQSLNLKEHITLTDNQRHYIKNVLRNKKNDFLKLFNGKDGEWLAKIVKIEKKVVEVYLEKKINDQKNSPDLWLLFAPVKKDPEKFAMFCSNIPMGRIGELHEFGGLALYLCSPASSYVTGAMFSIDGGWVAQ